MTTTRLLCLSDYFYGSADAAAGRGGGAGLAALTTFDVLRAQGVDAWLIAGFHAPSGREADHRVVDLGLKDVRDGGGGLAQRALAAVWNHEARTRLAQVLERFPPDETIVLLHQWTRGLSPAALDLLRDYRTLVYMHDYFWFCPTGAYFDFGAGRACTRRPASLACAGAGCDRSGAGHKAVRLARHATKTAGQFRRRADLAFVHISDRARSVALPFLPTDASHLTLYHPIGVGSGIAARPEPDYDIGYFGRLEPEKGVHLLLEAATSMGLKALFVGEGSLADTIEQSPSSTELRRWVPQAEVAALMRRCRAVVLPSIWRETWGLVTVEALSQGTPVVVSTFAGSAELVERYGGGATFDPMQTGALAAALDAVLNDPAHHLRLVAEAASVVDRAGLRPDEHGRRLIESIRSLWDVDLRPCQETLSVTG